MSPGNNKNECVAARKHWKDRSTDVRERGKHILARKCWKHISTGNAQSREYFHA